MTHGQALNPQVAGSDEIAYLDEVFHDMANALAEANRKKQELVAMVSHDLRTPLTSVQAALTLLGAGAMGELSDKAQKQVYIAEQSTTRLINLINDLLDLEKMESGKFQLNIVEASASVIIDRSVEAVEALAADHNITIETPDADLYVLADRERMVQVVVNLLSNAIKFSPDGSKIVVELLDQSDWVVLRVIDQGRGVPEKFKDAIFERFQQVERADGEAGKGTGLGLPICKAFVEAQGGTISVESTEGKGSTFSVRLPAAKKRIHVEGATATEPESKME
jgi:signal transduction histidine kinase